VSDLVVTDIDSIDVDGVRERGKIELRNVSIHGIANFFKVTAAEFVNVRIAVYVPQ